MLYRLFHFLDTPASRIPKARGLVLPIIPFSRHTRLPHPPSACKPRLLLAPSIFLRDCTRLRRYFRTGICSTTAGLSQSKSAINTPSRGKCNVVSNNTDTWTSLIMGDPTHSRHHGHHLLPPPDMVYRHDFWRLPPFSSLAFDQFIHIHKGHRKHRKTSSPSSIPQYLPVPPPHTPRTSLKRFPGSEHSTAHSLLLVLLICTLSNTTYARCELHSLLKPPSFLNPPALPPLAPLLAFRGTNKIQRHDKTPQINNE